jgi:site-specific recombinase XerD
VSVNQLRKQAGERWHDNDLVFASRVGTALWAGNVRRSFRSVLAAADLNPADSTPRELRYSFVSLMSDAGVPIEKIARLVGQVAAGIRCKGTGAVPVHGDVRRWR